MFVRNVRANTLVPEFCSVEMLGCCVSGVVIPELELHAKVSLAKENKLEPKTEKV